LPPADLNLAALQPAREAESLTDAAASGWLTEQPPDENGNATLP